MMNKTGIEYLDFTWNPLAMRCTPVSEGCTNCWHIKRAKMLAENPTIHAYAQAAYGGQSKPRIIQSRLDDPVHLKKSSRIGVQFMGDLFHHDIPNPLIECVWDTMFDCCHRNNPLVKQPYHIFLVLTKRPKALQYFNHYMNEKRRRIDYPNIWLGVTVENDKHLDRIDDLLKTPAAVRFVSLEPMLKPISFRWMPVFNGYITKENGSTDHLDGLRLLNWIIIGCESGPGRRPMKLEWAIEVVEECKEADVPIFVKQIEINGKVSHDMSQWPEELRVRQYPC